MIIAGRKSHEKMRKHLLDTNQIPGILGDEMPERRCVIMMGIPGSGKDTLARALFVHKGVLHSAAVKHRRMPLPKDGAALCSADSYFYSLGNGEYKFDPSQLHDAHAECFAKAKLAFECDIPLVVVNNTNTTRWERSPYIMLAEHYGYTPVVVRVRCPVYVALDRGTHGVPAATVQAMHKRTEVPLSFRRFVSFDNTVDFAPSREPSPRR